MLGAIVEFAIRFRGLVAALAVVLTGYGVYRTSRAGLDIFPEFSPKAVIIQTEAPGLATEQVEIVVTQPIEQALAGLIGLDHVHSESIAGLSIVTAVFDDRTDLIRDRQFVAERLAVVRAALPAEAGAPVVVPLASSSATVRTVGIQSDRIDLMQLRELVEHTLVPNLLAVPGVADVNVFGGERRALQVQIDAAALRRYDLGINELAGALVGAADFGAALGTIDDTNQSVGLQMAPRRASAEALAAAPIAERNGITLFARDVAHVEFGPLPTTGAAQIGGKPAIVLMIIGQYGANTLTVSNLLHDVLAGFQRTLAPQGIRLFPDLFVPANYIEASLANIGEHLILGAAFVLIVLVVFLFDIRAALISAVAIPLSLLIAVLILLEAGVNLNIMVMGGLAIALGEVVDDAIIDTENIYRRLRENQLSPEPGPMWRVIFEASLEVRGSVVYASFIVALVFVPLLTLSGVAGRLFAPLGVTYILAILASLAVALTVTPALCALLLGRARLSVRDPPLVRWLKPRYAKLLRAICRHPNQALAATVMACVAILAVLPTLGSQFLPPLREGHYIMHTTGLPGTSLAESIRMGSRLTAEVAALPGVRSVSQWAGRAERGADTYGTHYSEYEVALEPLEGREQQAVLDRIRGVLDEFPSVRAEVNTFLTERVDETISGYSAPVVVNLYGHDLAALDLIAREVAATMETIPGAREVQTRAAARVPMFQVELDPTNLARHGVRPQDARTAIAVAFAGQSIGSIAENDRVLEVKLIAPQNVRRDIDALGDLPVKALDGHLVRLHELATIQQVEGRYNILRRAGMRVQAVTCQVGGRALSDFWSDLSSRLATNVRVPADMRLEVTGAALEQARSREQLILHSTIAGIGVVALIAVALGRGRHVVVVLANLPFALVGGVLAVLMTRGALSVGSVVGFVTLFGITVRNSIMLVSHYEHLVAHEGAAWTLETVVRGATERLPSIAMTALVTGLAMLPIALDSDNAGREIMGPMAAIIIGGLASSAILNLLIMPAMMWRFGRFERTAREVTYP